MVGFSKEYLQFGESSRGVEITNSLGVFCHFSRYLSHFVEVGMVPELPHHFDLGLLLFGVLCVKPLPKVLYPIDLELGHGVAHHQKRLE